MNLYALSSLLALVTVLGISLFVFLMDRQSQINRSFGILGFTLAVWIFGCFTQSFTLSQNIARHVDRVLYIGVICYPLAFLHFIYAYMRIPKSKSIFRFAAVATSLFLLFNLYDPLRSFLIIDVERHYPFRFIATAGPLWYALVCYVTWSLIFGLYLMWKSLQASSGSLEKQKVKYLILSNLILDAGGLMYFGLIMSIWTPPIDNFLAMTFTVMMAYAIIQHQLFEIRIAIRRSLVYSALIGCITAAYLVMVLVMERWFAGFFGYRSVFTNLIVAFIIAILFNPLRDRIQALVDRWLFKATTSELATQREQLLEEVRKGEQMKAVGTLAAGLAHEVKNPLSAIKTFTEALGTKYDDPDFRVKFQKIVGGEVERINLIVHQLLEFAKPIPPKLTPLQVPKLLDETLELLNSELVARQVQVTKHFSASPPVLADPQQMKQVFLNLLLNSLQAMNGDCRLTLTAAPKGGELLITLEDTGCGIAPENLNRLGEPFFSTKPTGTGLGLAVVQSIVREHQGKLQITSQVGQGTRVEMRIPLAI